MTGAPDETAEGVLRRLQQQMLEVAEAKPFAAFAVVDNREDSEALTAGSSPHTLRGLEEAWGASATQRGRWLSELLEGSAAWEILERPLPGRKQRDAPPLPRSRDITRCEPLLRIMRESGELSERERLLKERDETLRAMGKDAMLPEAERRRAVSEVFDRYSAGVAHLADTYRPFYQEMRRAQSTVASLTGPRVRSHAFLQPPLMARLFAACHADKSAFFTPLPPRSSGTPYRAAAEYRSGLQGVTMLLAPGGEDLLDEMTWDIAAIAVCAFFARTAGRDGAAQFPFLIDDYFDWRGVDPRKRTREMRQQIDARVRLLFSREGLFFDTRSVLWQSDPESDGRRQGRRQTQVTTQGSFLMRRSGLFRPSPWASEADNEPLYGYLISLGEWALPFTREGAMVGSFPKRLAEYDLRRQQWERRIGWYLTFQMQNQGAKMTFRKDEAAASRTGQKSSLSLTPQHSLRMKTVLQNSYVPWEEMARTNPGKVIRQWVETLETLHRDLLLGDYTCLDGAVDGSDLPTRSRLSVMLNYRYQFTPGEELTERLRRRSARRQAE